MGACLPDPPNVEADLASAFALVFAPASAPASALTFAPASAPASALTFALAFAPASALTFALAFAPASALVFAFVPDNSRWNLREIYETNPLDKVITNSYIRV